MKNETEKPTGLLAGIRHAISAFIYSNPVQTFIVICIVLNSVQLGLETASWWHQFAGGWGRVLDMAFVWIFAVEVALKLIADGLKFFKGGWNCFDFLIVIVSLVPGNGVFSVLRVFRIFRTFRLMYRIPRLKIITESLLCSIPSIGWICLLLVIFFYICSVVATNLFGGAFPDWFGSIGKSMYSLFQIMTLESWSMGIVRPVMEKFPYAWLLFVPFIVCVTYTIMNLFIGIMVSTISDVKDAKEHKDDTPGEEKTESDADLQTLISEIRQLRAEVKSLREEQNQK
ncbi:MAG: ion transporter [Lentisphaeria bacterium]|nr:ion transporter [Lentisphaeria bacterium]